MKLIKLVLLLGTLIALSGCPPICTQMEEMDCGPIHDSILTMLPYSSSQTIRFRHSGGHEIEFAIEKKNETHFVADECFSVTYSSIAFKLSPNYPLFNIEMATNNFMKQTTALSIYLNNASTFIPFDSKRWETFQIVESVNINSNIYHNVFKLKMENYQPNQPIRPDSLYFNFEAGILLIKMTNNETFSLI